MPDDALFRMIVGLVLVIAAILACAWLARRSGLIQGGKYQRLSVVSALSLGPRQRIVMVEVEGSWLVVGCTASQMTLLHTLPAAEASATPPSPATQPELTTFAAKFSQALKRR